MKQSKIRVEPRGLGDTLANLTYVTGINLALKAILGENKCGCKQRQEALNKAFPYKKES